MLLKSLLSYCVPKPFVVKKNKKKKKEKRNVSHSPLTCYVYSTMQLAETAMVLKGFVNYGVITARMKLISMSRNMSSMSTEKHVP